MTSIAAGTNSARAIRTRGITTLKTVWAWGANDSGQLGDGTLTSHLTPEQVTGIGAPSVTGISAGDKFAAALGSDGTVWAWGADDAGQLGNAATASPVTRPVETTGMDSVTGKVLVPGLSGVTQVSAGVGSSLAIHPARLVIRPA